LIPRRSFFISDFPFAQRPQRECQATSKTFPILPPSAAA
jgi:hypothetical protein